MKAQTKDLDVALSAIRGFTSPNHEIVSVHAENGVCDFSVSGDTGSAKFVIGCDTSKEEVTKCTTSFNKLISSIRSFKGDETSLTIENDSKLVLKNKRTRVSLPLSILEVHPTDKSEITATSIIDSSDWLDRSGKLSWLNDKTETRVVQACHVTCEGNELHVVASTSKAWGCSSMPYKGDEVTCNIPHEAMGGVSSGIKASGDPITAISSTKNGNAIVMCGRFACCVKSTHGTNPRPPSKLAPIFDVCEKWEVPKKDICDALSTASIFITETATGVWLIPSDEGLVVSYTGESDGTLGGDMSSEGQCGSIIEGEGDFKGGKVYASHRYLYPMVHAASPSDFHMVSSDGRIGVVSDGYMGMAATMAEPGGKN